jgi:hypothetical protein
MSLPHELSLNDALTRGFGSEIPEGGGFAKLSCSHVVHSSGFDVYAHTYHKEGGDVFYRDVQRTIKCPLEVWVRRGKAAAAICWKEAEMCGDDEWSPYELSTTELGRIQAALAVIEVEAEPSPKYRD